MAKYWTKSTAEIDMYPPNFGDVVRGDGKVVNEHVLKIGYGDGYFTTLRGDFNINDKGHVTGGTVTRISFEDDDHYGSTLSGIDISLRTFLKACDSKSLSDDMAISEKMFSANDKISGSVYDDDLHGFSGNDTLIGNFGDDVLNGGDGDDTLTGGFDADTMTGGLGADIFLYRDDSDSDEDGADRITDFSQLDGDKISLERVGFFDFDTEIRFSHSGGNTIVEVDVMGGWNFPLIIRLTGEIELTEADFIL